MYGLMCGYRAKRAAVQPQTHAGVKASQEKQCSWWAEIWAPCTWSSTLQEGDSPEIRTHSGMSCSAGWLSWRVRAWEEQG